MFERLFGKSSLSTNVTDLADTLRTPDEHTAFIDVREQTEWDTGHIVGFRHIPLAELPTHADELLKTERVYFLCRSGGRSAHAVGLLAGAGHHGAVNVLGGINAWIAEGFPLERSPLSGK